MSLHDQIEALKARDYGDIPVEVCGGLYQTIITKKYATYWTNSTDEILKDWLVLSGATEKASGKTDLIFIADELDDGQLDLYARRVKKGGQIAFCNVSPLRLRKYFDAQFEKWSTFEPPIDLYIAQRL